MKKKYKLITKKVKDQSRKVDYHKRKRDKQFNRLVQNEKRKEKKYIKRNREYMNKHKRTKRYHIQKSQGHLHGVERPQHYINKEHQLRLRYKNEMHGNKFENINIEHRNYDRIQAILRVGENQIFQSPILPKMLKRSGKAKTAPIELESTDLVNETKNITQDYLLDNLDLNSQRKVFDLDLPSQGGHKIHYNQSGRHILIGGIKGSLSAFDWRNFKLIFECSNIGNGISDVKWMMDDSLVAVANYRSKSQVYDDKGRLVHVMHDFNKVEFLEYLLFHFLLVGGNGQNGTLMYKDISLGTTVSTIQMKKYLSFCQNPYNALICVGHLDGTVSMISPRDPENEPVISMLTHKGPVNHVLCEESGNYMVTCSTDNTIKIWDIRKTFKSVNTSNVGFNKKVTAMAVSQSGMVAYAVKNTVRVLQDFHSKSESKKVYMKHSVNSGVINSLKFCNYEDVLGIGYTGGVSSILIPGSGNSILDSREPNPYFTDRQVKKWNVDRLLEKIPWEMICLDPRMIASSGKTSTGVLKLQPEIKKKIEDLDYEIKDDDEDARERFFNLPRHERHEIVHKKAKEDQKRRSREKKWYHKKGGDALMRFGDVEIDDDDEKKTLKRKNLVDSEEEYPKKKQKTEE